MLKFLADEDFNNRIVRGLRRRSSNFDIFRVQEAGLTGRHDSVVLEWAAVEGRLLLTHDVATMILYANRRVSDGLSMPGIVAVSQYASIGEVIEDLILLAEASFDGEWDRQVIYLPYR